MGFKGKEKDNETFSGAYDFGARILDVRLGSFLSIDARFRSYAELGPYVYVANNPVIYVDPDGNDIVYFDSKGKETKREVSDKVFETRVDLKDNGNYSIAPMPNIIKGYEDAKYQQHDYIIAAETHIFNNVSPSERPKSANGLSLDGDQPVALSPTLVKAIILEETNLGTFNGENGQNGKSDIMQANVTTTNGDSDWNDGKAQYGLEKGKSASPQQSVRAGIRILYSKGLVVSDVKYNKDGVLSEDSKVSWKGGELNSWWEAVKNYNGNNKIDSNGKAHKENYVSSIFKNWNNSFFSKDSKYYASEKK